MHFDALTLACIKDELVSTILNGRVQQVLLPDDTSVGMELYARSERSYLLINTDPQDARVHLSSAKLRRGASRETPLLLLLRKYVRGSTLSDIEQPDAFERVLDLHFDHPEHGASTLVVEPMGRVSNMLLLDANGMILECMRRVGKGPDHRRVLLPGQPYAPPPPIDKLPPTDDGASDYYGRLATVSEEDGPLWKAIVRHVAGVSPSQARELAWRATGSADAPAEQAQTAGLAQALQELWAPVNEGGWQPGNVQVDGVAVAFCPYEVHYRGDFLPCASMSEAIERYHAAAPSQSPKSSSDGAVDEYAAVRAQVAEQLRNAQQRIERQLTALAEDEPESGEPELLRTKAEWLLALGHSVERGQESLSVDVNGDGSETLEIKLDPQATPVDQAQRMFKRAAKLERAAVHIPRRRRKLKRDLTFLAQLENDLSMAENRPEIAMVSEELQSAGFVKRSQKSKQEKRSAPGADVRRFNSPSGYEILAGRNARQNELVTFRLSHPQDVWLHARGAPGSHVVIRCSGNPVSDEDVQVAAQIAAYFSELHGERSAEVIVTERRNVHRLSKGHTGQVTVRNEKTVTVPAVLPSGIEKSA